MLGQNKSPMQVNGALHSLEGSRVIIHHNLTQGFFLVILSVGHKMNLDENRSSSPAKPTPTLLWRTWTWRADWFRTQRTGTWTRLDLTVLVHFWMNLTVLVRYWMNLTVLVHYWMNLTVLVRYWMIHNNCRRLVTADGPSFVQDQHLSVCRHSVVVNSGAGSFDFFFYNI